MMKGAERFIRPYQADEDVFCEGDIGKEMFVVVSGSVEIFRETPDGTTSPLASLSSGEMFGEMALVAEGRRFASARAGSDGAQLVCIDQARFVYLVSQQPAFALSVIRMMAQRLAGVSQQESASTVLEGA